MPFISNQYDPNDPQNQQNQQGQPGAQTTTPPTLNQSAEMDSAPAAGKGGSGGADSQKPSSSGMFVNLQKYVDANADQSPSTMVAGKLGAEGDKAQKDLSDVQSKFNSDVDSNTTNPNNSLVDQAVADPTSFVKDQNNVQAFQKLRDAVYNGPTNLQGEGLDAQEGQNVQDSINQLGSESGQKALLQRYASRPDYSEGQQNLDQYLFQNSPASQADKQGLQNQFGNIANMFNSAQTDAATKAQQAAQATQAAHDYANNTVNTSEGSIRSAVQGQVAADNKQAQDLYTRLAQELQSGKINKADLQYLPGITDGMTLYNVNPLNAGNLQAASQADINSAATADQVGKYQALQQLMGQTPDFFSDPSKAGSFSANPYWNKDAFTSAQQAAEKAYNQGIGGLQFQYDPGLGTTGGSGLQNMGVKQYMDMEQQKFGDKAQYDPYFSALTKMLNGDYSPTQGAGPLGGQAGQQLAQQIQNIRSYFNPTNKITVA